MPALDRFGQCSAQVVTQTLRNKRRPNVAAFPGRCTCFVAALLMGLAATAFAVTPLNSGYHFTLVASSSGDFSSIDSQLPLMLEDGSVLFQGRLKSGVDVLALGDGGPLTTVTSWTGAPATGIRARMLGAQHANSSSTISFFGNRAAATSSLERVYQWSATTGLEFHYRSDGAAADTFNGYRSDPSINDAGQIAFVASGQGLPTAIFVGDVSGTTPIPLASSGGPLHEGFDSSFSQPQILDGGAVIAIGRKDGVIGIHKFTAPGVSTPIQQATSAFTLLGEFDANRAGSVTFALRSTAAGAARQIVAGDEHGLQSVFAETSQYSPIRSGINDLNQVLVSALDKTASNADVLFTGSNPTAGHVVGAGNVVLGQTVLALFAGAGGINNRGQIAFWAARRNARTGGEIYDIVIATPVPEPRSATLAMWTAASLGTLLRRRPSSDNRLSGQRTPLAPRWPSMQKTRGKTPRGCHTPDGHLW
jgi:hypothetical protein